MLDQVPKNALKFLRWFCREDYLEEIEGNLFEIFEKQYEESPLRARRSFIFQVLFHFRPDFIKSIQFNHLFIHPDMLKHYFKISWRNLLKQKLYSFINIAGLAIGLAAFLLIFSFTRHEYAYDQFYDNYEQIYRVYQQQEGNTSMGTDKYAFTTVGLAPALMEDFPEVEAATTIRDQQNLLSLKDRSFYEEGLRADPNFLKVFQYPLLQGSAKDALVKKDQIILTQTLAKKLFGEENPIGKTITYANRVELTVSAILKDIPKTSTIQFSYITSILSSEQYNREMKGDRWNNNDYHSFFSLAKGSSYLALQDKLPAFLDRHRTLPEAYPFKQSYLVQPISAIHFENDINLDLGKKGNKGSTQLLLVIAILILILACINYVNLALARSIKRTEEVGLRKVIGAQRSQLIGQFLGESVFIAFLSLILALGLLYFFLPIFGQLMDRSLFLDFQKDVYLLPVLFLLVLLVGVLAGAYPALLISSLKPIQAIKSKIDQKFSGLRLQRILLVAQFVAALVLISSSLVVYLQFNFIQQKELGYDKDHIITISAIDPEIRANFNTLKNEWAQNPNILSVSSSSALPINIRSGTIAYRSKADPEQISIYRDRVDANYLDVFGIELLAGKMFTPEMANNRTELRVINETAAKAFGWTPEEAIGKQYVEVNPKTVIGVVKDFHLHSMHSQIAPVMLMMRGNYFNYISVKVRSEDLSKTIASLESSIKKHSPYPFEYSFLDERFDQLYKSDLQLGQLFGFFTILAILIASLGLFGMAAFAAKQRTKEIGIRKVMGASLQNVLLLLSKDFIRILVIAFAVSVPIAIFSMQKWLNTFAYHIKLQWWMFGIAGILIFSIAMFTVSTQTIKAALSDPVRALKEE